MQDIITYSILLITIVFTVYKLTTFFINTKNSETACGTCSNDCGGCGLTIKK